MLNFEEEIIKVVEGFLNEIKTQYPETKTFISRKYRFIKKKIEAIIPDSSANSQSVEVGPRSDVEMVSQVNIYFFVL